MSSVPSGPSKPSRPLGAPKSSAKSTSSAQPGGTTAAQIPRRHAGAVPGIARAASNLRQAAPSANSSSGSSASTGANALASLPAHLRHLSTPRIPSPLGKGTPARNLKQSFPVRTSKTTERHVFLPEDPQLAPLPASPMGSQVNLLPPPRAAHSHRERERESGRKEQAIPTQSDERSEAEKMTKREREEARLPRLTAYTTAEGYRLKLLQAFLKREHGVGVVRVFDDCLYAVSFLFRRAIFQPAHMLGVQSPPLTRIRCIHQDSFLPCGQISRRCIPA